jgi:hypothetical protein
VAQQKRDDALEAALGWPLFLEGPSRLGWLMNMTTVWAMAEGAGRGLG